MFPFSSKSIFSAEGILGNPGIVIILPVNTTINSAPALNTTSCTCILKGSLHSKFLGSSEKRILCFCYTYWQIAISQVFYFFNMQFCFFCEFYILCPIYFFVLLLLFYFLSFRLIHMQI